MEKGNLNRRKRYQEDNSGFNTKGVILIKNLVGKLEDIKKEDIRSFFEGFGEIEEIDLEINPETGKHLGFGLVLFKRKEDADVAIKKMNGYLISGVPIIVSELPSHMSSYLMKSNNEGYNKLEMQTARNYFVSKLTNEQQQKNIQNNRLEVEEQREKNLKEDIINHKYYKEEPTKTLGLFNLYGSLKGSLKEQRDFLKELKSDVKCKLKR
jgi:RNA recognition motif-containing protein